MSGNGGLRGGPAGRESFPLKEANDTELQHARGRAGECPAPGAGPTPMSHPTADAESAGVASGQGRVIALLSDRRTHGAGPVERIETHGAVVFLAGSHALKLKKAVRFPYLDFSTPDKRRAALERELELNRRTAPQLYLGLEPVVRDAGGALRLAPDGEGEVVDWVLRMRRFDQDALFDRLAARGELTPKLMASLADRIAAFHAVAPPHPETDGDAPLAAVVDDVVAAFRRAPAVVAADAAGQLDRRMRDALGRLAGPLDERARAGYVRRCHGDLHLRNIALIDGRPTLFDALEFDEALATIDVLYDLAFLLMDLWDRRLTQAANTVLNRYLLQAGDVAQFDGLAALPLFLGLRAAIRARVALDRRGQAGGAEAEAAAAEARHYVRTALVLLQPAAPRLLAIGGVSGTGKSTLGAALAPAFGAAPGAIHLRTDLERKSLFGVDAATRLDAGKYTSEATETVYGIVVEKAERALRAGHSVIVDGVFARPGQRAAVEAVARNARSGFVGLWLTAPESVLVDRVDRRVGDASDADGSVVRRQLHYDFGAIGWTVVDAARPPEALRDAVATRLGLSL